MDDNEKIQESVRVYMEKYLDGQNRCRRCNRPLNDPNQIYGWQCAQKIETGWAVFVRHLEPCWE